MWSHFDVLGPNHISCIVMFICITWWWHAIIVVMLGLFAWIDDDNDICYASFHTKVIAYDDHLACHFSRGRHM